jgi:dTDP-4-dehydrorhamnose 3,5-epimerase
VLVVDVDVYGDARGFFFESYHRQKFAALGITAEFVQDNHSRSTAGVVRGLHYQDRSAPMGKLVRCSLGAILDVAVDLRLGSPTFGRWTGVELSAENKRQLWVPVGFAHGFAVLSDVADVQYKCTGFYTPAAERVLAWDDPDLGVDWRVRQPVLSPRDLAGMSLAQYRVKPDFQYSST